MKTTLQNTDAAVAALEGMAVASAPIAEKDMTLSQYTRLWLSGQNAGMGSTLGGPSDPYRQSSWFHICVSRIAGNCSRVPVCLSRGQASGTRALWGAKHVRCGRPADRVLSHAKSAWKAAEGEIVETGDLYEFLRKPNPSQRWNQFFLATLVLLHNYGRVHWLFDDMAGRRPLSMYPIAGHSSKPVFEKSDKVRKLRGWLFRDPDGKEYPVTLDECVTFQFFDPADPNGALAPREPAKLAIIADYNASTFNAAMFANSCEPGTVLETDAPFNPDLDEQIRTSWQQRHRGPANARKLATLWGGLKHKSVGQTLQDMVWPEGKRLSAVEICGVLNIPPAVAGVLGVMGDSTAFVQSEKERFWQDTIALTVDEFGDALNDEIVPRFDVGLNAWFDLEEVPDFQRMRLARLPQVDTLWNKGVPMEDINSILDLGVPDRPQHKIGWLPMGVLPAEQAMTGESLPAMDEGESTDYTDYTDSTDGSGGKSTIHNPQSAIEKAAYDRLWQAWQRSWAPLATRCALTLKGHFSAQERAVKRLLTRYLTAEDAENAERNSAEENKNKNSASSASSAVKDPAVVARILVEVFDNVDERKKFALKMQRYTTGGWELGVRQAVREAGIAADAGKVIADGLLANPTITDAMRSDAVRISTRINASTRWHLRKSLLEGLEGGEGVNQLADRVEGYMAGSRDQALTSARNAVGQSLSAARHEGRKAAGVTHEIWVHSRGPGERREAHIAAEVRYRANPKPTGQRFEVGVAFLRYPRDPQGPPGEIINCQCVAVGKRIASRQQAAGNRQEATSNEQPPSAESLVPGAFLTYSEMLAERGHRDAENAEEQNDGTS